MVSNLERSREKVGFIYYFWGLVLVFWFKVVESWLYKIEIEGILFGRVKYKKRMYYKEKSLKVLFIKNLYKNCIFFYN